MPLIGSSFTTMDAKEHPPPTAEEKDEPVRKKRRVRGPNAKHWVFTDQDVTDERQQEWKDLLNSKLTRLAFQEEIGPESGQPHLQGCFSFPTKRRAAEALFKGPHYEVMMGTAEQASDYANKTQTRAPGCIPFTQGYPRPIDKWEFDDLCSCQNVIIDMLRGVCPRTDRTINWFWEPRGNWGKTIVTKVLVDQWDAMVLQGAGKDCLYGIATKIEANGEAPNIIIWDIPRVAQDHISYQSVEALKNALFFCGKFKSAMCRINVPHIVIFSNSPPDESKLSQDRWNIVELEEHSCGRF